VDKVALGQVFLSVLLSLPVSIIPPLLYTVFTCMLVLAEGQRGDAKQYSVGSRERWVLEHFHMCNRRKPGGSTWIQEMDAWFDMRIRNRRMKEAACFRVNSYCKSVLNAYCRSVLHAYCRSVLNGSCRSVLNGYSRSMLNGYGRSTLNG
jgi:hypothetical protein